MVVSMAKFRYPNSHPAIRFRFSLNKNHPAIWVNAGIPIWLVGQGHPSEKYEFVNWDDNRNPILMGQFQIHGNQTTNQIYNPYSID